MAAGLGFKDFTTGEVLTAADVDGYLMQGIWVFASAAARDSAVTSPQEGNACYLKDTNQVLTYSGSAWVAVGGGSPLTTKGDVYGFSTTDARIPIGANDTVLTADSTQALGLKWAAPAGGGGMTLIQEQTASGSSSINFTGIAGTYKQLLLVVSGIYHSGAGSQFSVRFNNSSATEYTCSGEGTNGTLSGTYGRIVTPQPFLGEDVTSSTPDDTVKANLLIDNYASTTKFKYFDGCTSFNFGGDQFHNVNGFWGNTAAITSVDIVRISGAATITNLANTSIRLYGIS
jgi:hypothetical protein